ncbi:unnamed protein product [Closterium sp. NIES-64]|nr:unnamed protein product [Closterium sp. NIES-64]
MPHHLLCHMHSPGIALDLEELRQSSQLVACLPLRLAIHARHNAPHGPARAAPAAAATGATHRCAVRFRLLLVSAACLQPTNLAPSSLPCLAISLLACLALSSAACLPPSHSMHPHCPISLFASNSLPNPSTSLCTSAPHTTGPALFCCMPASITAGIPSFPSPTYALLLCSPLFLPSLLSSSPQVSRSSAACLPPSPQASLLHGPQLQHPNALPAPSPFPFPALSRPARSSQWERGSISRALVTFEAPQNSFQPVGAWQYQQGPDASTPIKARSSKWGRVSTSRATVTRAGYHSPRSSLHWHAVATWADQCKQQLSMANNAMLSFVRSSYPSFALGTSHIPHVTHATCMQLLHIAAAVAGTGIAVHLSFLALNMGVMAALRRITPPLPLQEANAVDRAVIILSSQKTLPVAATVVEKIGTLMGEPALVLLPCILTHFLQAYKNDPAVPAPLLRLHFHDCFVQGCDASVLLDSTEDNKAEKDSDPNATLGAFDVVDDIKDHLEAECPGVVSCADILALAAREGIHLAGGPFTEVPLGRRDGLTSFALAAETFLPGSTLNVSGLVHNFNTVGLDMTDVVTLSGAHTIGEGRCVSLKNRLEQDDPTMDPEFAAYVKQKCGTSNIDPKAMIENDYASPNKFDNQHQTNLVTHPFLAPSIQHRTIFVRFYVSPPPQYYKNLLAHKGLFTTDQALIYDDKTEKAVKAFAHAKSVWFDAFPKSLVKMGVISPLTGTQGEVRLNCHVRNTY